MFAEMKTRRQETATFRRQHIFWSEGQTIGLQLLPFSPASPEQRPGSKPEQRPAFARRGEPTQKTKPAQRRPDRNDQHPTFIGVARLQGGFAGSVAKASFQETFQGQAVSMFYPRHRTVADLPARFYQ